MASSPPYQQNYNSSFTSLAPLKRPGEMSNTPSQKRRKQSTMSVTSNHSAHPLRQTSFPPDEVNGRSYSPDGRSPSVDNASLVSGSIAAGKQGKKRGRKPKHGGDDGGSMIGSALGKGSTAASLISGRGQREPSEDVEEDDGGENMGVATTTHTEEEKMREKFHRSVLVDALDKDQYQRYEAWRSAKLSDSTVRRLVNQTLSQSVPQPVVIVGKSVGKKFAGDVIELARKIQTQYLHASVENPAAEPISQYQRYLNSMANTPAHNTPSHTPFQSAPNTPVPGTPITPIDVEMSNSERSEAEQEEERQARRTHYTKAEIEQWEKNREEKSRPPLLPEHLREASRRIRATQEGGLVGMMGLDRTQHQTGVERFGNKFGGKRVLR